MKKTQRKDALRDILRQKVSYISVVVIAMLAITIYLGIAYGAQGLYSQADSFFRRLHLRDAEIVSTMLVSEEDLAAIRALDGIADAEGVYQTSGKIELAEENREVSIVSLCERINTAEIKEGRMPENAGECLLEQELASELGIRVGESICLASATGEVPEYLRACDYTVVGIAQHPDYYCTTLAQLGARYVMVLPQAFDTESLGGCFMKAEVRYEKPDGISYYSEDYLKIASVATAALNGIADARSGNRDQQIQNEYGAEIEEGERKLAEAKTELEDGRKTLDEKTAELADGEKLVKENEEKLRDAEAQLAEGKEKLEAGEKELAEGKAKLDETKAKLDDARFKLDQGYAQLQSGKQELADTYAQIEEAKAGIRSMIRSVMAEKIGELLADKITWAQEASLPDLNDPGITATAFLLAYGINLDLHYPVDEVLEDIVTEILAGTKYEGREWLVLFMIRSSSYYQDIMEAYSYASEQADAWNEAYHDYLLGLIESDALTNAFTRLENAKNTLQAILQSIVAEEIGEMIVDQIPWAEESSPDMDDPSVTASEFWVTTDICIDLRISIDEILEDGVTDVLALLKLEGLKEKVLSAIHSISYYNEVNAMYSYAAEQLGQWDEGHDAYIAGLYEYFDGEEQYYDGAWQYTQGLAQYEEGLKEYEQGKAEYEENYALYADGKRQLEEGREEIAQGKEQLAQGEAEYADGLSQYETGLRDLAAAKEELAAVDPCRWVVLDINGSIGYQHAKASADNISNIGKTFSLLFVLIGALVIYATVGRIVEEQRKLVGTTKALGLFNREILYKYLTFALSATLLGSLLGVVIGYFVIQKIILLIHEQFYVDGAISRCFLPLPTLILIAVGALLATLSVWSACFSLVRSPARELMQERVPSSRKKTEKGNSRLPLYTRLILRNAASDKKRIVITAVSIAGCCTLLMIGFTMRYGVTEAVERQYHEIMRYDQEITVNPEVSDTAFSEIEKVLTSRGAQYAELRIDSLVVSDLGALTPFYVVTGKPEDLYKFYETRDAASGDPILVQGEGILIQSRMSEDNGIGVGDTLTLYDEKMAPITVPICGVYNNYLGHYIFFSEEAYAKAFSKEPVHNTLWVAGGSDADTLPKALLGIEGYEGTQSLSEQRRTVEEVISALAFITGLMIIFAGLMAYFILLNLTGMYLMQKQRELTIMRINGFTTKEVIRYVSREMQFTALFGIVLGLAVGRLAGWLIIRFIEQANLQFERSFSWTALIFSALLTAAFAFGINAIALRKVKKLKLTDL